MTEMFQSKSAKVKTVGINTLNQMEKKCPTSYSAEAKHDADRDETPPRTPTGNAPTSESDIDVSSPANKLVVSQEEDERLAKELSLKEAAAHDLSHRPKRRRFHESYNFNMKCPTPGCNSLGERAQALRPIKKNNNKKNRLTQPSSLSLLLCFFTARPPDRTARETFLHIGVPPVPQSFC